LVLTKPGGGTLIKIDIDKDPYKNINWTKRLASIKSKEGEVIYEKEVLFPDYFSDTAVNITASKYFHKSIIHEESNLQEMIDRVSNTIVSWDKINDDYKLKYYQIHQIFAFNSPVYFNLGLSESPQASACFILSIEDDMKSITDTMSVESKIFKKGSGSGMNLSKIRSKYEYINGQTGQASGPVSFLKVHDTLAQIIRSGGALRRSAKLACLNMDHPDIEDFIDCKKFEEEKLTILKNAGIKPRPGYELSDEVYFQSTNLSVRPSNKFMEQVLNGGDWSTRYITTGEIHKTYKASDLLMRVAQRTWEMGDPAIQFDDTVNDWNTVLNDGRISSSNPCNILSQSVLTPSGYIRFRDLKNKIYLNGEKECSDIFKTSDCEQVYEVELKNGMCLYVTGNHKISTKDGDKELQNIDKDKDIVKVYYGKIPYTQNDKEYEEGFIAGYLYAEGSIYHDNTKNYTCATFCIGVDEFDMEDGLVQILTTHLTDCNKKFAPHYQKPNTCKVLTLNQPAVKSLIKIFGSTTKDDFDLLTHSLSYQKGFVEAFITFDGHCNANTSKSIRVTQSGDRGLEILRQIQLVLASFSVYSNLCISNHAKDVFRNDNTVHNKVIHNKTVYSLIITDVLEFSKYFNLFSPKKQAAVEAIAKIPKTQTLAAKKQYQPIKNIREFSKEAVYDINVPDGAHFVAGGFIVHNCSEFLFLDNSSCNLASINLIKFFDKTSTGYKFNFDLFKDVVETVITAQDTIVDFASYPTELIMNNSIDYRPLGLGFTNLGSLLMILGLPYDSNESRLLTSYLTALLTGIAYQTSNKLAKEKGAFNKFKKNKSSFYSVLNKHADALDKLIYLHNDYFDNSIIEDLAYINVTVWNDIKFLVDSGEIFRNSQVTLMAPCGTIGYLMDSQTSGIEPEYSHVKYKRLSNTDSGVIKLTSDVTKKCLENLGYNDREVKEIECYITDDKPLALCKCLRYEHSDILNTSTNTHKDQTIHYSGHIKMLGAIQPFISGGISKTVNFSNEATVEDIYNCYIESWKLGLKGVAIYRDGSKSYQPLSITKAPEHKIEVEDYEIDLDDDVLSNLHQDDRLIKYMHSILAKKKLPDDRPAMNHKFTVDQIKGYLNLGMFENGELGEVFIKMSKEGSTLSGLLDCLGTLTSISLQRGVPLKDIVEKMCYQQFNPSGFTSNPQIRTATSIVDYIFKYIGMKFLKKEDQLELGLIKEEETDIIFESTPSNKQITTFKKQSIGNGKICDRCSHIMILKGTCYTCVNCFSSTGSCG
jgi:ribonucleoside-diphosphate reductase alpha chain